MDVLTKAQRSFNMSRIRSTNTSPELLLFKLLEENGISFVKHFPILGKPDVAFPEAKIVVFLDGEFWHGRYIDKIKHRLPSKWLTKIKGNIERDKIYTSRLKELRWKVIRVWEDDFVKSPEAIVAKIINMVQKSKIANRNQSRRQIDIFSFFAGVGFLDLGFENSGYSVKYVNEYVSSFLNAYKHARKRLGMEEPEYGYHLGDINDLLKEDNRKVLEKHIAKSKKRGSLVGFIAGPPCPDFSVGGKNRGGEGERGKLSQSYIDLIIQQKPDFFLFENVKGLWRTKKHREFFEKIKKDAHKAGYVTDERLLNAIEYGVPQDRDRIILLGFKRSLLTELGYKIPTNVNTLPEGVFPWNKYSIGTRESLLSLQWPVTSPFQNGTPKKCPPNIKEELTIEYWFRKNDVVNHPNSKHAFTPKAGLKKFLVLDEGDVSKKSYKRLHRWRYSPTAAYGNNEVHVHPYLPRRISVAEALAIQSLPKRFVFPEEMTLTDMFKTIGNGVPYLLSKSIADTIKDFLR